MGDKLNSFIGKPRIFNWNKVVDAFEERFRNAFCIANTNTKVFSKNDI
jgi:hypothetical protein